MLDRCLLSVLGLGDEYNWGRKASAADERAVMGGTLVMDALHKQ